jgi:hypothetical protein
MTQLDPYVYDDGKLDAIRNPEGIWINSQAFREEGSKFTKRGYYTNAPWESPEWYDYWGRERDRCTNGYSVGGAKITGDHYFYLNYCPIMKVDDASGSKAKKVKGFPDFWDGDYNYFWIREIAREGVFDAVNDDEEAKEAFVKLDSLAQALELKKLFQSLHLEVKIKVDHMRGGWNLIVGKSRRKGYSLKSAGTAANNLYTKPESYSIFGAYEKKFLYPKGLFSMAKANVNFINKNTGWACPSDVVNKQDHIKMSFLETNEAGITVEDGLMSELQALTFKDNADAARGKDAYDIWFEESGAFGTPGLLKDSYSASEDCVMAGAIKTGMITIFGTSGDMEGGTADYADMHSRPEAFGLLPFENIWDEGMEDTVCGFFHPIHWNMEGHYDEQGNSNQESAREVEKKKREELIKNGATSVEINKRMQEKPFGPAEAFSSVSVNNFPVVELKAQLRMVLARDLQRVKGTPVELYYKEGGIVCKPILDGSATPVTSYHNLPTDKRGNIVIYEMPIDNPPKGLYKIGYDPVRQDRGSSLAAIVVYKGVHKGSYKKNIIAAEYVGRTDNPEDMDRIAEILADFYNTKIMHENEVTSVKNFFRRIKRLNLLAAQPDKVISANIKNSKVQRVYGCHMTDKLKDACERYTKEWLLEIIDYAEDGTPIKNIDNIFSVRALEELIAYNRKGNFDWLSGFFMCMIQDQEQELDKEYGEGDRGNKNVRKLLKLLN